MAKKGGIPWGGVIIAVLLAFLVFATVSHVDLGQAMLGRDRDATPIPDPAVKGRGCVPAILAPLFIVFRLLLGRGA